MDTINERIKIIADICFDRNVSAFARNVDVKQSTLREIVGGKLSKPSSDILEKIIGADLNISAEWLLTGKGHMRSKNADLYDEIEEAANEPRTQGLLPRDNAGITVPLISLSTQSGINDFAGSGNNKDVEYVISPIKNMDFAMTITGDSMSPEYPSGSRIYVKMINPESFIEWGKVYILETSNGMITKEIHEGDDDSYVACHSVNPDPKFKPFKISRMDIYRIYKVVACLITK